MSYRNIPSDYSMIMNVENKWFCSLISVKTVVVSKGMAPVDPECTAKQGVAHVFTQGKDIYDVMLNQVGTLSNIQFIQYLDISTDGGDWLSEIFGKFEPLRCWKLNIPDQYHGCWWPGSLRQQDNNSYGIDSIP